MLGLDSSNSYSNRRYYCVCYKLLERRVHNLRVSYDFLKMSNYSKKLFCVCELGEVIKTQKSRCYCFYFSLEDIKKKEIYWLSSSYVIKKFLQDKINAKSLLIAYIIL